MRPLEALLLLANVLSFLALAVPRLRAANWTGALPFIGLLVAALHLLLERYRWQMMPAYALTLVLLVGWMLQRAAPADRPVSGLLASVLIVLGALSLVISTALPVIVPVFHFPRPSGPYAIGTLTYHWVDEARPEVFTAAPDDHRELLVQIWYPAEADPATPTAPYMQDSGALSTWLAWLLNLRVPEWISGELTSVKTNAVPSAPVAPDGPDYPVVIFMEGLSGFRQMNTYQVEHLVSHGYVVAAIDQPYAAAAVVFPDGRQVTGLGKPKMWPLLQQSLSPAEPAPDLNGQTFAEGIVPYLAQDAVFTLDQLTALNRSDPNGSLTGRLDLDRVGIIGVSLGGIVSPQVCHIEPRVRACLMMEAPVPAAVVQAGLEQPTLLMIGDVETMRRAGWSEADIEQHQGTMRGLFEGLSSDGYLVVTHGLYHLNLTDAPLFLRAPLRALGLLGPVDVDRAHDIVKAYTLAFFDHHLKGQPTPLLSEAAYRFEEVTFETR